MTKPTALCLYGYAGGFTLGVKRHFQVLASLEVGYGAEAMHDNQPDVPTFQDINTWPVADLMRQEIDFVYGNPPCAAWSPLGQTIQKGGGHWETDPRVDCARILFAALDALRPAVWAWESVPRAFTAGRPFVDHLTQRAQRLGYTVSYVLHNAMYLGGLQNRKRFFMVCHRVAIPWTMPRFTTPPTVTEALRSYKPNGQQAVPTLRMPARLLKRAKPGGLREARAAYVAQYPEEDARITQVGFAWKKLHPDRPAQTITGGTQIHPHLGRPLSIGEMLHLSGFPPDYRLTGSPDAQASLIARGVLPPVGEWLARHVAAALDVGQSADGGVHLVDIAQPPGQIINVIQ